MLAQAAVTDSEVINQPDMFDQHRALAEGKMLVTAFLTAANSRQAW